MLMTFKHSLIKLCLPVYHCSKTFSCFKGNRDGFVWWLGVKVSYVNQHNKFPPLRWCWVTLVRALTRCRWWLCSPLLCQKLESVSSACSGSRCWAGCGCKTPGSCPGNRETIATVRRGDSTEHKTGILKWSATQTSHLPLCPLHLHLGWHWEGAVS